MWDEISTKKMLETKNVLLPLYFYLKRESPLVELLSLIDRDSNIIGKWIEPQDTSQLFLRSCKLASQKSPLLIHIQLK